MNNKNIKNKELTLLFGGWHKGLQLMGVRVESKPCFQL